MRTVLLVDLERIKKNVLTDVQFVIPPKLGEHVRVWLNDDYYRDGKVVRIGAGTYDVGGLGEVMEDKLTDRLRGMQRVNEGR